ncbi:PrsW family intramembrane metalloprotease [Kovacikia minuta CCNUW1]|uniref:PrsW family intramembrane metalloprotease n=1 Tax=Kovacikia minuta TaxID=2931930 RepID=UPI001CCA7352|nr:PrsW family intramembrane metalloprotease [Kovacikia minuta]UBF26228.1 PrsW family intramembrane metalloprotease [Kovacikia minuta CCNUW1]
MTSPDIARILYGSPLAKPRTAKFAIAVLLVLVLISSYTLFTSLQAKVTSPDGVRVMAIAFLWSALFSSGTVAILWFLDRREHESRWLYAIAFLWGAFIATGIALPFNQIIISTIADWVNAHPAVKDYLGANAGFKIAAPIAGPLVEEITKGAGVLLIFLLLKSEFDDTRDGFIYGALIGAGFNFLESVHYIVSEYAKWGYAPWLLHIGGRHALFGLTGHALYTGIFGLFLGWSRQTTRTWWRYLAPVVGWLLGFSAHFSQNIGMLLAVLEQRAAGAAVSAVETPPPSLNPDGVPFWINWVFISSAYVVKFWLFLLLVGFLLWRSGVWERRVIRDELANEVEPIITPEEYEGVKRDRILKTRRIAGYNRRTAAAIVRAQDELAFRKWRLQQQGQDVNADALVTSWRGELLRLRESIKPNPELDRRELTTTFPFKSFWALCCGCRSSKFQSGR